MTANLDGSDNELDVFYTSPTGPNGLRLTTDKVSWVKTRFFAFSCRFNFLIFLFFSVRHVSPGPSFSSHQPTKG